MDLIMWYVAATGLLSLFMFIIWSNKNWINITIKFVLGLTVFAAAYIIINGL